MCVCGRGLGWCYDYPQVLCWPCCNGRLSNSHNLQPSHHIPATQALECREPRHRLHDLRVYLSARAALFVSGLERPKEDTSGGQQKQMTTACFFASLPYGCLALTCWVDCRAFTCVSYELAPCPRQNALTRPLPPPTSRLSKLTPFPPFPLANPPPTAHV